MLIFTLLIAPMFIYFALVSIGGLFSSVGKSSDYKMPTEIERREQERYEWLNSGLRY